MENELHANVADDGLPDFVSWFCRSKIVHEDGRPKIVYHGTRAEFDIFQCHKRRNSSLGIHFGSVSQAEFFATYDARQRVPGRTLSGGRIVPAYLRIENPLRMPDVFDRGCAGIENVVSWLLKNGVIGLTAAKRVCRARSAREANRRLANAIEEAGHDGITYENEHEGGTDTINEDSYIVFHARQIRSIFFS